MISKYLTPASLALSTMLVLAACQESSSASAAGQTQGDYVSATASGPVNGQIEYHRDAAQVTGSVLGVACVGPWPMINLRVDGEGRSFGMNLKLRLPQGAQNGNHPITMTGANNSVRASLQVQAQGANKTAIIKQGQLQLQVLEQGYAGEFEMDMSLTGAPGDQHLKGAFRSTQVSGNCG